MEVIKLINKNNDRSQPVASVRVEALDHVPKTLSEGFSIHGSEKSFLTQFISDASALQLVLMFS